MGSTRTQQYRKQQKQFSNHKQSLEIWKGKSMAPKKSKLDPELKSKWVAELRSGKYVQGAGRLKKQIEDTEVVCHCCLGVLCEIIEPEGFKLSRDEAGVFSHSFGGKSRQDSYPNQSKMMELGLYPSTFKKLAAMNDGEEPLKKGQLVATKTEKASFEQIADYIEKNL